MGSEPTSRLLVLCVRQPTFIFNPSRTERNQGLFGTRLRLLRAIKSVHGSGYRTGNILFIHKILLPIEMINECTCRSLSAPLTHQVQYLKDPRNQLTSLDPLGLTQAKNH